MKDPVIERKMSQFREGSLSFNRGIPIYREKLDTLSKKFKLRTHHPKSWILSRLFWGGEALPGSPSLFGHDWSSQCIRYKMTENRQCTHRSQNDPDSPTYLRTWSPDDRSNNFLKSILRGYWSHNFLGAVDYLLRTSVELDIFVLFFSKPHVPFIIICTSISMH